MPIPVLPVSEAIIAMKRGENIVFIQPLKTTKGSDGKVKPPKEYNGSKFFQIKYKFNNYMLKYETNDGYEEETVLEREGAEPSAEVKSKMKREISRYTVARECNGDFSYRDLITTRAPLDPSDENDPRRQSLNIVNGTVRSHTIQSCMSKAGELGEFLSLLMLQTNAAIKKATVTEDGSNPDAIPYFEAESAKIRPLVKTRAGKGVSAPKIEDPIIYIKSNIGKYPSTYPIAELRNTRKSVFYDALSMREEEAKGGKKKIVYDYAVLLDAEGNPLLDDEGNKIVVDDTNLFKYLKFGSKITHGRINCGSLSISNVGISVCVDSTSACVIPGNNDGSDAEYEDDYVREPVKIGGSTNDVKDTSDVKDTKSTVTIEGKDTKDTKDDNAPPSIEPVTDKAIDSLIEDF